MSDPSEVEEPPIRFTDNRKIDREPSADEASGGEASAPPPAAPSGAPDENAQLLEERTRDLQRVSAEYANYRKRMERENRAAEERGVARALNALLPVLDDWDRARDHGDVTGQIEAIVDKQWSVFTTLGLELVGAEGDEFDPQLHEAVLHDESDDVTRSTVTKVLRKGYRFQERLLRAAMVGVTDPLNPQPAEPTEEASDESRP